MKERPILFSAPMVRAILAGTKTQTRRVVKPQPEYNERWDEWQWPSNLARSMVGVRDMGCLGPYGSGGDQLWVRETWYCDNTTAPNWNPGKKIEATPELVTEWRASLYYRADAKKTGTCCELIPECMCADYKTASGRRRSPWKPGIHMPRWASRIDLGVVRVHVERLHSITEEGARAEGVEPLPLERRLYPSKHAATVTEWSHRAAFHLLWESINGAESWRSNPWVWVVEFKRIETPAQQAA